MERGEALLEGRRTGRRGPIGLAIGVCLLAALVILPASPTVAKGHHKAVSIKFGGLQSDQALLTAGAIPMSVRSSRPRKVEFTSSEQAGPAFTQPTRAKLRRGRKSILLPLSTAGRELLQGCGARRITVTAMAIKGKTTKGKRSRQKTLASTGVSITTSVPQCDVVSRSDR